MRYLIIVLLVMCFSFTLFAQKKFIIPDKISQNANDDIKLNMKMLFKYSDNSGRGALNYTGIQDTVVKGYYYVNEAETGFGVGTGKDNNGMLSSAFFGFPSWENKKYDIALSERRFNLESLSNKPNFSKVVFFEIKNKLLKEDKDSIALFFKYSIYSLIDHFEELHYNFEVKLFHKMIIVPYNEITPLKFISKHFKDKSVSLVISKTTKNERDLYSKFTSRNFYPIYESIKESKIKNNVFNLGLEFVRSNRENRNILLRQLEYPLESALILADEDNGIPVNLPTRLYKGEFKQLHFSLLDKEKAEKYKNDKSVKRILKSNYDIFIVPIKYEGNDLSIDVFIEYQKFWGFFPNPIKKRLTIGKGEKLKLEIPNLKRIHKFGVNKRKYEIDTYEDYEKYVNEYIVISFEYAEEE